MARIIWQNENHDGEDLTSVDFTNAYFNNCSFKGTKFGNCKNATFVDCNFDSLTIFDDLTGADFQGDVNIFKQFINNLNIFPAHSHKIFAAAILNAADTETHLRTKKRAIEMANYIAVHPELSYPAFIRYFNVTLGWYPDVRLMRLALRAFSGSLLTRKVLASNLKSMYPQISEAEWQ